MSKSRIVSVLAAATMSTGLMAGPAFAHQRGLVNVNVEENDIGIPVNVQAPIGIAANVCGVNAAVLAAAVRQDGDAECDATAEAVAQNRAIQRFL
ncbi:MAG: hypothetical protein H0V05_11055 [Euzebyaceae bacterium]|nr:hypothetical protein [Euzebyaceae bacterium]